MKCFGQGNLGQLGYGDTQSRGNGSSQMGSYLPWVDVNETVISVQAQDESTNISRLSFCLN